MCIPAHWPGSLSTLKTPLARSRLGSKIESGKGYALEERNSIYGNSKDQQKPTMHFPTQMSRSADTMSLSDSSPPRYTPYDSTTYLAHVSSASTKAPSSAVEKGIYRSRFVLRLLNVTFAAAAIGSLSLAVRSYNSTKDSFLLWEGKVIWPEGVVMKPSETYFALTGTFLATGSALLLASIWPKVSGISNDILR